MEDSFTFEDWKVGLDYFKANSFCYKFDLSQGYHHIDIFPPHQTFLGFSINGKYYCFFRTSVWRQHNHLVLSLQKSYGS